MPTVQLPPQAGSKLSLPLNGAKAQSAIMLDEDGNIDFQETAANPAAFLTSMPEHVWLLRGLAAALDIPELRSELHSIANRALVGAGNIPGHENLSRG